MHEFYIEVVGSSTPDICSTGVRKMYLKCATLSGNLVKGLEMDLNLVVTDLRQKAQSVNIQRNSPFFKIDSRLHHF